MGVADRGNEYVRRWTPARRLLRKSTALPRHVGLPVLAGAGRGLRLRVGDSTLMRVVSSVEPDVEWAWLDAVGDADVVFDVGANIGWFSLLAARRTPGHVVAFEPSPANAACAQRNATANHLHNVRVVASAVGAQDGWASFDDSTSLTGKLSATGNAIVPVVSLDSWTQHQPAPDVVKIDVEGAEGDVLRGMRQVLAEHAPTLIIELHGTNHEIADLLDDVGYAHRPIDHPAATREAPWWVHLRATRCP